jgi:hypothetical protein
MLDREFETRVSGVRILSSRRSKKASSKRQQGGSSQQRPESANQPDPSDGVVFYALLYLAFFVVCLTAYHSALDGSFLSDDEHYVLNNAFVHDISVDNAIAILDPTGTPAKLVENYAPVHLFIYALEWQWFERDTTGYHAVNIALHALASLLLMIVLRGGGISRAPALLGSVFFLLHPANVEAVAWISQLKTPAAMILCLLALIAQRSRPALAAGLFALALFAKPTAAVALFVLALSAWQSKRNEQDSKPSQWGWIGLWVFVLVAFAVAEFWAFNQTAGQAPVLYADPIVRMRTVCAIALRYFAMAIFSSGLSVFHEPPPAASWFDPWWLGSLVLLSCLALRTGFVLMRGRTEALYWVWAAVSFAPICGIIPLPFPMADRYLYFILPGLIGAVLFAGRDHFEGFIDKLGGNFAPSMIRRVLAGLAIVWIVGNFFVVQERAAVWRSGFTMMADAEKHYPAGMAAQTRIAHRLALAGDAEGAVAALLAARARGYNRLDHLLSEQSYDRIRNSPQFKTLVGDLAREWIERYEQIEAPDQFEYRVMAQAYIVLDDLETAIHKIEAGIEVAGPITEELTDDLADLLRVKRIRESRLPDRP